MSLRVLDLYAGVGGWSYGMRLAGLDVVASFEWWNPAAKTNELNNHHPVVAKDLRQLSMDELPLDIDVVVGSPPCTQFSYSNRGGAGNIDEGLKDIATFLNIVDHLKPKFWVMENVPRVKSILLDELQPDGELKRFNHMLKGMSLEIVDASEFGLPQKRKRCFAGKFPHDLFHAYKFQTERKTLRKVISNLEKRKVTDPLYQLKIDKEDVSDIVNEASFSEQEIRINSNAKAFHPVYNDMKFPDFLDAPSRTVTATCTRVSRESVVIKRRNIIRRLNVRERACVQGFPINYEFFGESVGIKNRMIGNAVPPLIVYFIAKAILGVDVKDLICPDQIKVLPKAAYIKAQSARPDSSGANFNKSRKFKSAIPNLRFKSGLRFELSNEPTKPEFGWSIDFYYGDPSNIYKVCKNLEHDNFSKHLPATSLICKTLFSVEQDFLDAFPSLNGEALQRRWLNPNCYLGGPFEVIDWLGNAVKRVKRVVEKEIKFNDLKNLVEHLISTDDGEQKPGTNEKKMLHFSTDICSGLHLQRLVNKCFLKPRI